MDTISNYVKILLLPKKKFGNFLLNIAGDETPWMNWFNETYCKNCKCIKSYDKYFKKETEFSFCEVNGVCIHGEDFNTDKNIIKLWLNADNSIMEDKWLK